MKKYPLHPLRIKSNTKKIMRFDTTNAHVFVIISGLLCGYFFFQSHLYHNVALYHYLFYAYGHLQSIFILESCFTEVMNGKELHVYKGAMSAWMMAHFLPYVITILTILTMSRGNFYAEYLRLIDKRNYRVNSNNLIKMFRVKIISRLVNILLCFFIPTLVAFSINYFNCSELVFLHELQSDLKLFLLIFCAAFTLYLPICMSLFLIIKFSVVLVLMGFFGNEISIESFIEI